MHRIQIPNHILVVRSISGDYLPASSRFPRSKPSQRTLRHMQSSLLHTLLPSRFYGHVISCLNWDFHSYIPHRCSKTTCPRFRSSISLVIMAAQSILHYAITLSASKLSARSSLYNTWLVLTCLLIC